MPDDVKRHPTPHVHRSEDELLEHPDLVLTLLEDDQLVSAKQATKFGRMQLTPGIQVLLWALRVYVVLMLVIVVVQVIRTLGG